MYFRINDEIIIHAQRAYTILDYLGSVGGVYDVLMVVLIYFYGGYATFNSVIETLN